MFGDFLKLGKTSDPSELTEMIIRVIGEHTAGNIITQTAGEIFGTNGHNRQVNKIGFTNQINTDLRMSEGNLRLHEDIARAYSEGFSHLEKEMKTGFFIKNINENFPYVIKYKNLLLLNEKVNGEKNEDNIQINKAINKIIEEKGKEVFKVAKLFEEETINGWGKEFYDNLAFTSTKQLSAIEILGARDLTNRYKTLYKKFYEVANLKELKVKSKKDFTRFEEFKAYYGSRRHDYKHSSVSMKVETVAKELGTTYVKYAKVKDDINELIDKIKSDVINSGGN